LADKIWPQVSPSAIVWNCVQVDAVVDEAGALLAGDSLGGADGEDAGKSDETAVELDASGAGDTAGATDAASETEVTAEDWACEALD